jgi:hypothetical protein
MLSLSKHEGVAIHYSPETSSNTPPITSTMPSAS